jgi:isopenicillin N synthase-like dioxygenase
MTDIAARSVIEPVSMARYGRDFEGFAGDLGRSFERYGFAVIGDHGLDQAMLDAALAEAKGFFALPDEVKRRYHVPGAGGARGYTPFGIETAKGAVHHDLKEFWHAGRDLPPGDPYRRYMADNVWPAELADFRPAISAQFEALDQLGLKVLRAIAHHLRIGDDFFEPTVRRGNSILRLLH